MHNTSFEESQHKVVQSRRVPTANVHVSLAQFEEQVIMFDVCKHPKTLVNATIAYVEAINLNV